MAASTLWLIAYDIADPTRLREVATYCEDVGRRLQQSVFLCSCTAGRIETLHQQIHAVMDPAVDHLLTIPLCGRCEDQIQQYGLQKTLPGATDTLVV